MEYSLRLGECAVVRRGWLSQQRVFFVGESSTGIFSVVVEWSAAHNSAAYNLYFAKSQKDIALPKGRITVLRVDRNELHFRYERSA